MPTSTTIRTITCRELNDLCQSGQAVDLIDVRTPAEFQAVHSIYARNVPLDTLKPEEVMPARGDQADQPLYVICRSGSRSRKACEAFVAAGYTNIVDVEGGTQAWEEAGFPVNRGRKMISLERQVRIAAGLLILTGAVLSQLLHPYWIGLSAFVGAGLLLSGITDSCQMAMVLAKMPWNQVPAACETRTSGSDSGSESSAGGGCCG